MKLLLVALLLLSSVLFAAGEPFKNLGFDDAITNNFIPRNPIDRWLYGDGAGPSSEMLPGWQVYSGTNKLEWIGLNASGAGYDYATLYNENPPQEYLFPVEGQYSLDLVAGHPLTLLQTGELPVDSQSIHMVIFGTPVQLEVSGSLVPLFYSAVPFDARFAAYSQPTNAVGDISRFAGQTVELKFIAITPFAGVPGHGLDSIYFSSEAIPEPAVGILLLTGLILLATAWRGRKGELRNRGIAKVSRCNL